MSLQYDLPAFAIDDIGKVRDDHGRKNFLRALFLGQDSILFFLRVPDREETDRTVAPESVAAGEDAETVGNDSSQGMV